MAKAHITTDEGVSVKLEGTPDEISSVLQKLRVKPNAKGGEPPAKKTSRGRSARSNISDHIDQLRNDKFFKTPRQLGEVRKKLGELGHHYPIEHVSVAMLREVRKRSVRRFKEKGKYVYAQ